MVESVKKQTNVKADTAWTYLFLFDSICREFDHI